MNQIKKKLKIFKKNWKMRKKKLINDYKRL